MTEESEILPAVWAVMAEHGLPAVSMRTVAAAAGVSVGRIQYRFGSKDQLIRASLEAMLAGAAADHAAVTGDDDIRAELWDLLAHAIPRAGAARQGVAVFHQYVAAAGSDPELARLLAEAKRGQEQRVTRLLRQLDPDLPQPRTVARSLVATADGLVQQVLIGAITVTTAEHTLRRSLALHGGDRRR